MLSNGINNNFIGMEIFSSSRGTTVLSDHDFPQLSGPLPISHVFTGVFIDVVSSARSEFSSISGNSPLAHIPAHLSR